MGIPSGKHTFKLLNMAIEIVDLPIENGGSFQFVFCMFTRPGSISIVVGGWYLVDDIYIICIWYNGDGTVYHLQLMIFISVSLYLYMFFFLIVSKNYEFAVDTA